MGAQMRVYRQRIRSVKATQKITNAMELIAASRVVRARQRVLASAPYTHALTAAVSAVAGHSNERHPLTSEWPHRKTAGVIIMTSDRGLAGAYSVNVLKQANELIEKLAAEGVGVRAYLIGRKAIGYYKFRQREYAAAWEGFTDSPTVEHAREIGDRVIEDFLDETDGMPDEIHIVYTRFKTMVTQEARVLRLLPLQVVDAADAIGTEEGFLPPEPEAGLLPLYAFEPNAETVLDALLPRYVATRIYTCLLGSAASELAARQRAMKSATDNAGELIKKYTRMANQARQAEITQEISEIVGGANALAESK
jgi:F-type H+-transporting ATPase subunit gamma